MHNGHHPYDHWSASPTKSDPLVAGTAANLVGSSRNRKGLVITFDPTSAAVPVSVRIGFGSSANVAATGVCAFQLSSVVPWVHLKYCDWGETLNQAWWAESDGTPTVYTTEIMDANPNCECYG